MCDKKYAASVCRMLSVVMIFSFLMLPLSAQTKKRGKVTTEYASGVKESSGKVKNYKKQGVWKYWSEFGVLTKTVTWKDDAKQGLYTEYYPDGKKSLEGNYLNDRKNSSWSSWYTDGKMSSLLNYDGANLSLKGDVFYGLQQWWYENGQRREQSNYEKNGQPVYRETWYNNGKRRAIEKYENGKPDGTWRKYPEPGESRDTLPSSIDNYSNGKREGVHLGYMNGRLSEEIYYKDDQLDGTYKKWDQNSQLGVSENYVNVKRDGLCRYFNYGKCIREVMYEEGRINGEEKEYDSRGELFRISWYKKGIIDSAYNYHKNGRRAISRTYKYYPGIRVTEEFSEYTEWDSAGILLLRGTYHFERKDKDWTTYYANGNIKSITPWAAGRIKGVYKKWYANGKKMIEMECEGIIVSSQPKVWDEKGKPIKAGTKSYNDIVESSMPGEIYNNPKFYKENRTDDHTPPNIGLYEIGTKDQDGDEGIGMIVPTVEMVDNSQMIYTYAEVMPQFPGSGAAQVKFIQDNLKYPAFSKEQGKQGTVYISYIVEKDGSITNVKEVKSVPGAPDLTKEAIRLVSSFPKHSPALMNGKPVRLQMTTPIRFVLE